MILLKDLSECELNDISYIIAEAFASESGILESILGDNYNEKVKNAYSYFGELVKICYEANSLYATSENQEGFAAYFTKDNDQVNFTHVTWSLFGKIEISRLNTLVKALSQKQGYERIFKEEQNHLIIFLVVVKKEFQRKGFMRNIIDFAFSESEKLNLPCVLDTDSKNKEQKYIHLGMETVNTDILDGVGKWFTMRREKII